jgi:diguanylate cyclase (GGDEF)-like protein
MDEKRASILIVDDSLLNLKFLERIIIDDYEVFSAQNGTDALALAIQHIPDLVLLDIVMPGMSGYDVLQALRANPITKDIPVIFITGLTGEQDEERGLMMGAADYITKPFRNAIVKARIRTQIAFIRQKKEIEQLSLMDSLTNIPNRRRLELQLSIAWDYAVREQGPISILMLDVDKFKVYNDTYGHQQGDELLKSLSRVLSKNIKRGEDLVARYGGEEFIILLPGAKLDDAIEVAEHIRSDVADMVVLTKDGKVTKATISIGVASICPFCGDTSDNLIAAADEKLYRAKNEGRNRVCY